MWSLAGPFLALGVLLIAAGVPKLRDPAPLVRALRSAGIPATHTPVRVLAAAEVLVGVAAIIAPGRTTGVALAGSYALFTGFVGLALRAVVCSARVAASAGATPHQRCCTSS